MLYVGERSSQIKVVLTSYAQRANKLAVKGASPLREVQEGGTLPARRRQPPPEAISVQQKHPLAPWL
jgi:hypothetical protein